MFSTKHFESSSNFKCLFRNNYLQLFVMHVIFNWSSVMDRLWIHHMSSLKLFISLVLFIYFFFDKREFVTNNKQISNSLCGAFYELNWKLLLRWQVPGCHSRHLIAPVKLAPHGSFICGRNMFKRSTDVANFDERSIVSILSLFFRLPMVDAYSSIIFRKLHSNISNICVIQIKMLYLKHQKNHISRNVFFCLKKKWFRLLKWV